MAKRSFWQRGEDYAKKVSDELIEQIKRGVAPWQKPWKPGEQSGAENFSTGKKYTGGIHALITAASGFVMLAFVVLMLLLAAVTYAQVIWAQIALAILIILGPIFIPFLMFEPLSFLFLGWFRAMITYSLYAVMAGAVLRVFSAVGISYTTTLGNANLDIESLMDVGLWMLAVVPLFVSGMLASLKCGELASMLVTSTGAAGSGLMGMATTAGAAACHGPGELVPKPALPDHRTRQRLVPRREPEHRSARGGSGTSCKWTASF